MVGSCSERLCSLSSSPICAGQLSFWSHVALTGGDTLRNLRRPGDARVTRQVALRAARMTARGPSATSSAVSSAQTRGRKQCFWLGCWCIVLHLAAWQGVRAVSHYDVLGVGKKATEKDITKVRLIAPLCSEAVHAHWAQLAVGQCTTHCLCPRRMYMYGTNASAGLPRTGKGMAP
jgi:hypothetical protein